MMSQHSPLVGRPGQRQMHNTLRQTFCWPHIAANVYYFVCNGASCAQNNQKYCHERNAHLFPAGRPLGHVATHVVGPFPKTWQGNQYILFVTNRYFKLTRAASTSKTTAMPVASVFVDHWLIPYGKSTYLLTGNGTQIVKKFFATVCALLGVEHLQIRRVIQEQTAKPINSRKPFILVFNTMSRNIKKKLGHLYSVADVRL